MNFNDAKDHLKLALNFKYGRNIQNLRQTSSDD